MPERFDLGPRPRLGYVGNVLDRATERRGADAQDALLAATDARLYVISGENVVLRNGEPNDPLFGFGDVPAAKPSECVFLGLDGPSPRFAVSIDAAAAEIFAGRPGFVVTDLRSIATGALVAADHLPALAEAKALLAWHARHRFCSNCGAPTNATEAGWRRDCPACGATHFPRTDPVVIMLAVDGDRCLLGRQPRFAPGMWSCLAGFLEPGESLEEAVRRETLEESGIVCGDVTYLASQPWPFPMSLMIGCHAQALSRDIVVDRTELEDARWFSRREVADMLARRHADGLMTPPPVAIAHHLIRAWVEDIATEQN